MTTEDLHSAIKDLREELRRIEYAIASVESVAEGKALRGRPPKFVSGEEPGKVGKAAREGGGPDKPRRKKRDAEIERGNDRTGGRNEAA